MSKIISPDKIQLELNKLAKAAKTISVNDLRMILALERVVARVENHKKLSKNFVFKGGFVLLKTVNSDRFTRDVDALAIGLSRKHVPSLVEETLSQDLQDGLWFGDVKTSDLVNQGPYGGYTFNAAFTIGKAPSVKDPKIKKFPESALTWDLVTRWIRCQKNNPCRPYSQAKNLSLCRSIRLSLSLPKKWKPCFLAEAITPDQKTSTICSSSLEKSKIRNCFATPFKKLLKTARLQSLNRSWQPLKSLN